FAVQGFGRVGSEFARLMEAAGARLVAASTRAGAAWNPRGLAVAELLARRARRGDEFIRELPGGAPLDPQALLELEVDVLVPAAGCGVLHAGNRGRVRAAVVACAANAPMDADTERALTARGVIVVPDFVANCGGILGTTVEPYLDGRRISRLLDQEYRPRVEQLLEAAAAAGATLTELAAAQAEARLAAFEVRGRSGAFRAGRRLLRALPRVLRAPLAYPYCARSLFRS
ncbi:MAG TPA: hypothetical protein VMS93_08505, partial [Candidatus Saccharimonadales bacterium]|nr:hypothetical protein [Candidatus Saccharimonadales bacterium]